MMPQKIIVSIILICQYFFLQAQIENFDIEYPLNQEIERFKLDGKGMYWLHDNKDFYYYNGHQVKPLGLGDILGKKAFDYSFSGDIVFIDDRLLFMNDQSLSLVHPVSKEIENIWTLSDGLTFDHLYEDDLGRIWIFTQQTSGNKRPVFISSDDKLHFTEVFDLSDHIGNRGVFWDFELDDNNGLLHVQWRLGDLLMIDDQGLEVALPLKDKEDFNYKKKCSQFRLDNNNNLWRIRDQIFEIYDTKTQSFEQHSLTNKFVFSNNCNIDQELSLLNLRAIYQDSKDRIWMTFAAAYLIMYDPVKDISTPFREPIIKAIEGGSFDIKSIVEDQDGNIWGNKEGGLFKIRDIVNLFESYAVNSSNPEHPIHKGEDKEIIKKIHDFYGNFAILNTSVHDIIDNGNGELFIQDNIYTYKIDRNEKKIQVLPLMAPKEKMHFYKDQDLTLFATWDKYYIADDTYNFKKKNSAINKIENTLRLKNGDIWISGLLSQHQFMMGKLNVDNLEFEGNYIDPSGAINFDSNYVWSIDEDSQGRLWMGSDLGIFNLDTSKENGLSSIDNHFIYKKDSIVLGKQIDQIQCLENELLWFKSKYEIGLINTDKKELVRHLSTEVAPYNAATTMIAVGDSVVWLGYKEGLIYHNFNSNISFTISQQEGIDTKGGVNVMRMLDTGDLAIGTNNGLYICQPNEIVSYYYQNENSAKRVPITLVGYKYQDGATDEQIYRDFFQNNNEPINLNYTDRNLEVQYALTNYNYPKKQRYTHILEGYESEWSDPSDKNFISYTNLPPGQYVLKVKGDIGTGIWSENQLSVDILVRQAWFRNWWFIIGGILLLSFMIYLVTRYYLGQELKRQKGIEKLRSKISTNLHDDVGTILTGIAMQSELLEDFANDKAKPVAHLIAERSREAMGRMRDTVWAIDSKKDTVEDLKDRIMDFLYDTLTSKEIMYEIKEEYHDIKTHLKPDIRQAAYLIFKESIANIVKHSDTDKVLIDINVTKKQLSYVIKDNGTEKDSIKTSGLGLNSIRNRAKSLKGTFSFSYDNGYKTQVSLPL